MDRKLGSSRSHSSSVFGRQAVFKSQTTGYSTQGFSPMLHELGLARTCMVSGQEGFDGDLFKEPLEDTLSEDLN